MDMNEATSKAIAAERSAARMTIKELAKESGVPERTLIRLIKNERNINVNQLAQISNAIGLYPHELIETAERYLKRENKKETSSVDQTLSTPTDNVSDDSVPLTADGEVDYTKLADNIATNPDLYNLAAVVSDEEVTDNASAAGDVAGSVSASVVLPVSGKSVVSDDSVPLTADGEVDYTELTRRFNPEELGIAAYRDSNKYIESQTPAE